MRQRCPKVPVARKQPLCKRPASAFSWAIMSLLAAADAAAAGQLEVMPRVDVAGLHETNARLSRQREDDATGIIFDGRLNITRNTPRTELVFNPRFRLSRYDDKNDKDLEDDDWWLIGGFSHRAQRFQTDLQLSYSQVGVRTSELESAEDSPGGSADLTFIDDTQKRWQFSPSLGFQLTQQDQLQFSIGFNDVKYDRVTSFRFDYRYLNVDTSWQHNFSPKIGLGTQLNFSRFESENQVAKQDPIFNQGNATDNDSQTFGGSIFLTYMFSQRLIASVYAGARRTDIELRRAPFLDFFGNEFCLTEAGLEQPPCIEKTSGDNFVGELRLTRTSERTQMDVGYSRSVAPSSGGAETVRDELRGKLRHEFSKRLSGQMGLLAYTQKDVTRLTDRNRDYVSLNANLEWLFARYWGVRGAYRFVHVTDKLNDRPDTDASNHYFFMGVFYRPRGWRW